MPITDSNVKVDQFANLDLGMNSDMPYALLEKNQASFLLNATARKGFVSCRPGFKNIELNFEDVTTQERFEEGYFQGAGIYSNSGLSRIICSISGRIFSVRTDNWLVTEISISGDLNPSNRPKAWFCQAEQWMVIQDGQSKAIIYNGSSCVRADIGLGQVPVGEAMAYGMGRLWVSRGREFVAGDIVGGSSGSPAYNYQDAVLYFRENNYIAGGGAFAVPLQSGNITGMQFIANINTTLGQSALMVFTKSGVYSVNVPADRATWADLSNPVMTVAQINFGSTSDRITPVNGDLFYRSTDGVRSLVTAVRFFNTWANTPISAEMDVALRDDNERWLDRNKSVLFDNRLLMTSAPWKSDNGIYWRGLMALDFNILSSLNRPAPNPAWDGLWTGLNILDIHTAVVNGVERCFILASVDEAIQVWELTKADRFDNGDQPIRWVVESPGLNFGNATELKELSYADLWVDRITGTVNAVVSYRPDFYPCWVSWISFSKCGNYQFCPSSGCNTPVQALEQNRNRIRLPQPDDGCNTDEEKPSRNIYQMQVRLQFTGFCRLLAFRAFTRDIQEAVEGDCPTSEECATQSCCQPDPYSYSSTS